MTLPIPQVEIGWKGSTTGLFTIGVSTLDGPDLLGTAFLPVTPPPATT